MWFSEEESFFIFIFSPSLHSFFLSFYANLNKVCHLPFLNPKTSCLSEEITLAKFSPEIILEGQFQTNLVSFLVTSLSIIKHFLCVGHCAQHIHYLTTHFGNIITTSLSDITISTLQKNKLRLLEDTSFAQSHTASEWWRQV